MKGNLLKIGHINAQSLQGNMEEIELLVRERNLDVLCISETWLLPHTPDRFVHIPHFNIFRCDDGKGGGVCVYVADPISACKVQTNFAKCPGVEDLWIQIQVQKLPSIILGVIYRHPHALNNSFDYISDILSHMCLSKKPLLVMGDLNDDLLVYILC